MAINLTPATAAAEDSPVAIEAPVNQMTMPLIGERWRNRGTDRKIALQVVCRAAALLPACECRRAMLTAWGGKAKPR